MLQLQQRAARLSWCRLLFRQINGGFRHSNRQRHFKRNCPKLTSTGKRQKKTKHYGGKADLETAVGPNGAHTTKPRLTPTSNATHKGYHSQRKEMPTHPVPCYAAPTPAHHSDSKTTPPQPVQWSESTYLPTVTTSSQSTMSAMSLMGIFCSQA